MGNARASFVGLLSGVGGHHDAVLAPGTACGSGDFFRGPLFLSGSCGQDVGVCARGEFGLAELLVVQRLAFVEEFLAAVESGAHDDFVSGFGQRRVVFLDLVVAAFVVSCIVVFTDDAFDVSDKQPIQSDKVIITPTK